MTDNEFLKFSNGIMKLIPILFTVAASLLWIVGLVGLLTDREMTTRGIWLSQQLTIAAAIYWAIFVLYSVICRRELQKCREDIK